MFLGNNIFQVWLCVVGILTYLSVWFLFQKCTCLNRKQAELYLYSKYENIFILFSRIICCHVQRSLFTIKYLSTGINQRKSFYLNKSCELTVDDYLYKIEFEKECGTTLSAETKVSAETENHLPYTLGLVCTAFVVVIIIVTFLVLKKKVGMLICP